MAEKHTLQQEFNPDLCGKIRHRDEIQIKIQLLTGKPIKKRTDTDRIESLFHYNRITYVSVITIKSKTP